MNEPFSQLVATLHKVQGTMGPQLARLAAAQHPDKVRLPRLRLEAGQLKGAAEAILGRMMQSEASLDLIVQAKALVTFFDRAEQHATALLRRQGPAALDTAADQDGEALGDMEGNQENDELAPSLRNEPGRVRSARNPNDRGGRNAARIAKLGLSVDPYESARAHLRRRSSI